MMSNGNPLDPVWKTYQTTKDCFKVTDRVRRSNEIQFLQKTDFIAMEEDQAIEIMRDCHKKLGDFAILSLWAVFERFLIDYIQQKGDCLRTVEPNFLAAPILDKFEFSVERLWLDDILEWLKNNVVDGQLIGEAKKIKKFRNYIAHSNPRQRPADNIDPKAAYQTLSKIMRALAENT
ncbi:MAG: hypothetical protein ACP5LD_14290 [Desulfomonilaceae bacterium]